MFDYIGGTPKYLVPDNLKAAVLHPRSHAHGQVLNAVFDRAMQHYGVTPLPARVRKPSDKGLVEQSVLHVKRWITLPLARQVFHSIAELNRAIAIELDRINNKPMRRLAGRSRLQIFDDEERSRLRALPHRPFRNLQHVRSVRVPEDYHLEHRGNFYSVPHELISDAVDVFEDQEVVSIFHRRRRVAIHPRLNGVGEALRSHQPDNHRYQGDHRHRYFNTWGRYQAKPIDKYLRLHLSVWKNPHATDKCARKLAELVEHHDEEIVVQATDWVLTHFPEAPHIKRIERLIAQPARMDTPVTSDGADDPITNHRNIRGANYYGRTGA